MSYTITIQAATNHVVDLSWQASTSPNVTGYNIYRSPDGATWQKLNPSLIASTVYADSTVADSSTYYYAATAVNVGGQESKKSTSVEVTIP
jgi:fibronectin type 3 domain-containing protein